MRALENHEIFAPQSNEARQRCFNLPEIIGHIYSYLLPQNKFNGSLRNYLTLACISKLFHACFANPPRQSKAWLEERQTLKAELTIFEGIKRPSIEEAIELIIENKLQVANLIAFRDLTNEMLDRLFTANPHLKHLFINPSTHCINRLPENCANLETFSCLDLKKLDAASIFKFASKALCNNKAIFLVMLRIDASTLYHASDALRNDKEIVLAAVKQNGCALKYASWALQNDKEVVLAAIRQDIGALAHASDALRNDKGFILVAMRKNRGALKHASDVLRNDKEVVLASVRKDWGIFEHASAALRNDKEVVLVAVRENGKALEYASDALQNDEEVVLAAVRQNKNAF